MPINEPLTDFTNSEVKAGLLSELSKVENEEVEIPCVVAGEKIYTGDIAYQVTVSPMLFHEGVTPVLSSLVSELRFSASKIAFMDFSHTDIKTGLPKYTLLTRLENFLYHPGSRNKL